MDEKTLRRRLARERATRLEAEQIAERALADLYEANVALDQRVREQTADLERALEVARRADAAKDAFLEGIAHRTGSPLHVIQGFIELVARDVRTGRIRDAATAAAVETRRLGRAFEVLLAMSQAVGEDFELRPVVVDTATIADHVLDHRLGETLAEGRVLDVRLMTDPALPVTVDLTRVLEILDALLDNAIEHGEGTITVELAASADPGQPQALVLTVEDEGRGVPQHVRPAAFEAFVAGDGHTGFGVGLTLARTIATAMGGRVDLDEDQPSRVVLRLPLGAVTSVAPVVDLDALRRLRDEIGVPGLVGRLSETYITSVQRWVDQLVTADDAGARAVAHQVSSTAKQLGMRAVGSLAKQVETHDGIHGAQALADTLTASITPLRRAVQQLAHDDNADDGANTGAGERADP